jgi:hypothetical protein
MKYTSPSGYEAVFKETMDNGALRKAQDKDIEEFKSLVDESVQFYEARDEQYRASRAPPSTPYPRQDMRQPGGYGQPGGYQNGSAYPPMQSRWPGAGQQRAPTGQSPYAAYNARGN